MRKKLRGIFIFLLIISVFMISDTEIYAKDMDIDNISIEDFVKSDKEYLSKGVDIDKLYQEIAKLSEVITLSREEKLETKTGAYIYTPDVVEKTHKYSIAKRNRLEYLRCQTKGIEFKYNDKGFYTPMGKFNFNVSGSIPKEVSDLNLEQAKIVFNNLDIDKRHTENVVYLISPYWFDGMNGYSYSDGSLGRHDMAVIANYYKDQDLSEETIKSRVKGTILHELGHIFHNEQESIQKGRIGYNDANVNNVKFWIDYNNIYKGLTNKTMKNNKWETNQNENFAEDFRIYYSGRLGKESFEPEYKKTSFPYKKEVEKFIEDYINFVKEESDKSFAKVKLISSENDRLFNIQPSSKIDYAVVKGYEDLKIKIDNSKSYYKDYIIYGWNKNNKIINRVRLDDINNYEYIFDLINEDKEIQVITVSVIKDKKPTQKWRIDVVR